MTKGLHRYMIAAAEKVDALVLPPDLADLVQPLADSLSPLQREVFLHRARFRVIVAGRRSGKTRLELIETVLAAAESPGSNAWYIAPTYRMAKRIAWRDLLNMVPPEFMLEKNTTDLSMRLTNGSEIALRGADDPDSLRGDGLDFVGLDEFAWIDEAAWSEVLRPALADRQGRAMFTTTPRGFNWAYDLYQQGLQDGKEWHSWHWTTAESGFVPLEELEAARAQLAPQVFAQEFEASFENLAGRVYSNFSREHYPAGNIDPGIEDNGGELLVGMDFNIEPMSAVIAQRQKRDCVVLDSLEIPSSNTQEVADEILIRYPGRQVIVCPDPSGRARRTSAPVGQTDFTILRRAGFEIRAPLAAPAVVDRVNNTQSVLLAANGARHLRIHPRAQALIRCLDGLCYKPGTNQPDKTLGIDHLPDALGYLTWQEFNVLASRLAHCFEWRV
jgi:hypothetical protein